MRKKRKKYKRKKREKRGDHKGAKNILKKEWGNLEKKRKGWTYKNDIVDALLNKNDLLCVKDCIRVILIIFHHNIRGNLSIIRCNKN